MIITFERKLIKYFNSNLLVLFQQVLSGIKKRIKKLKKFEDKTNYIKQKQIPLLFKIKSNPSLNVSKACETEHYLSLIWDYLKPINQIIELSIKTI